MDLSVELPGEGTTRVSVPGTARVGDVLRVVYQQKGLAAIADKLGEFSLAKKGANECVDVAWLDLSRSLQDQGPFTETLVLKKKYFVRNDELQVLDSSEVLLRMLFTQLLQSFKAGLFRCSVFQAAQIVATVLKVQKETDRSSPDPSMLEEDLKGILPEHLSQTAGIDQLVAKAMKTLKHVSMQEAQKKFITRLQKLEAFGMAFFSAEYEECSGFIGISPDSVCCIEKEGMETFNQWDTSDLSSYIANDAAITMVFAAGDPVTIATPHGHIICDFMQGMEHIQMELKYTPPPATKPDPQDQVSNPSKAPPTATLKSIAASVPPPARPPPRRPIPAPRSGRLASASGDVTSPGGGGGGAISLKEDVGKGPSPKPRLRLASGAGEDSSPPAVTATKTTEANSQPEKAESSEASDMDPVAYLEPKKSVHRVPPITTTPQSVFGVFQKKPERPSIYATVRDSMDDLSIILESDLNSELSISAEENPIYDANASKEVEICIRSCNATYKALNQSFKQSFKQRAQNGKIKDLPLPPPPPPPNIGPHKKVPILPPAPTKPPPPHKPPPILVKGGAGVAKQSASGGVPPTAEAGSGTDTHQPFLPPSKPKITKISVSKSTEDGPEGAYEVSVLKVRSKSVTKDIRPSPTIADKAEAAKKPMVRAGWEKDENLHALAENRMSKKSNSVSDVVRPPKPPRAKKKVQSDDEVDTGKQKVGSSAPSDEELETFKEVHKPIKDFATLLRDFRIFYVKLPNGSLYTELENIRVPLRKMLHRLCALVQAEDYSQYSIYVEGSALSVATSKENGEAVFDVCGEQTFILLPEQGANPVLLDPEQSLYKQGLHSTRILALRKNALSTDRLQLEPANAPEWTLFYKYSVGIVQGTQPCSLHDAIKLAALHYQVCLLDRTDTSSSIIELCSAEDLVSHEYYYMRGIADKIHTEHQKYKEYTLKQAQEAYIQICQGLPTHNTVFFPCKEVKQRSLFNNKLTSILIGINHDGVVRVDSKTKEILDMWPYQVIQNWGFGSKTLMLHFADSSYPVKTTQGKWMTALIDFNVELIVSKPKPEPNTNKSATQNYEQDPNLTERMYEELLYVESQSHGEYDVLQHFPAHRPPGNFPSSGDYEPVIGGGVYSALSVDFMDNRPQETLPDKPHPYEVINPHL